MDRSMKRISLLFFVVFAIAVAGVFAFDRYWVAPGDRCEAEGGWWDMGERICATPIYIPDVTGRRPGESREAASRRNARELVELERRYAARERQRQAAREEAEKAFETP